MNAIRLAISFAALLFIPLGAKAGTFSIMDNFDGYATDAFITDDFNWSTTDLWQNNGVIPNEIVPDDGGQAGWIGGLFDGPTTTTSYLTRSFEALDNNRFTFRWTQNIANAALDDGIRDKFGWTVRSTTGTDLLTLMFLNASLPGQNLLAQGYSGSLLGTSISSSNALGVSNRGEWAQFEIVLDSAANTWSASLFNADPGVNAWQTFIEGGSVNGASGSYTVGQFSAVWDLADTSETRSDNLSDENQTAVTIYTSAGQNIMMFDNLSISGVPEPSSLSLFTFGALAYLASRRRSRS